MDVEVKVTCTKREFAAMLDRCIANRNSINREYCRNCLLNPACKERYGSGIVDFCEIKEE